MSIPDIHTVESFGMIVKGTKTSKCYSKLCRHGCRNISRPCDIALTHWGRVTHKWVSKLTILGSDNGLAPIIWTNAGILLIGSLGTNFSEILIEINIQFSFSFKKLLLKTSSAKWRLFCLGLNAWTHWGRETHICVSVLTITGSVNGLDGVKPLSEPMLEHGYMDRWVKTSVKS